MGELDEVPPLRCTVRHQAGCTVVTAVGEIDMDTLTELDHAITTSLEQAGPLLVIDLTGVTFLDSTGLRALFDVHQQAERDGRKVRFTTGSGAARRPIELAGLGRVLSLHDTLDSALASG